MKGIILAAGKGTRMYPMTRPVCKPLLPVYDKPLIYYPLAVLQEAGIKDVLIIVPPNGVGPFEALLGNGGFLGMNIIYKEQPSPRGIADAFILGKEFIGDDNVCLVLGDNIFYGDCLRETLNTAALQKSGATIFGYRVEDPRPFGVVEFDENGKVLSIEEKPENPKSNYIVPGIYFYDSKVVSIAENIKPSARGELEITDVNNKYLELGELKIMPLDNDFVWLDAGNEDNLLKSAIIVSKMQRDTKKYVACIEEKSYENGWINKEQLHAIGNDMSNTKYGRHILSL